mgnify:CR=1 FL=1
MADEFNLALSYFSHHFGPYIANTDKGYYWAGKTAVGLRDQLDENGYWLELTNDKNPSVTIHDFYTFDPDLPDWAIAYVVGFCKIHNIDCTL